MQILGAEFEPQSSHKKKKGKTDFTKQSPGMGTRTVHAYLEHLKVRSPIRLF